MKVEFVKNFYKDLKKLNPKELSTVKNIILTVESAKSLSEINNVKKLQGFNTFYRIRFGNYRIGFEYKNEVVTFLRVIDRKDIYKNFP
jgi:mRNA interferase RelE/StbE